ncbi:MAG: hypothetical protein P1U39_02630 [Legionellaceae bacterium]|nr:hypothetical protein [Legionellaceae bacterium]
MIKINTLDILGLKPKIEQGEAFIQQFKLDLEALPEKDATTEYILKHVLAVIELSQGLEKYIFKHIKAISNPMGSAGRKALAEQVEALFAQASQMDFDQVMIDSEQAHEATAKLLQTFEGFLALFPDHNDEHLKRVVNVLGEKITAYQASQQAEHQASEENAEVYVLSEPEAPINDLPQLYEYVATEFGNIDEISDLNLKIAGYQALEAFTIQTFISLQDIQVNQEIANQLLKKITDAHQATEEALDNKIEQIINKHEQLTNNFRNAMDAVPERYKKQHAGLFSEVDSLIGNLTQAADDLKNKKDMAAYKIQTKKLLDDFLVHLEQNPLAKRSWFRQYMIEPFERLKVAIIALVQSMHKALPDGRTPQQLGFFSNPKEQTHQNFESLNQGLKNLDLDDEVSPKPSNQ